MTDPWNFTEAQRRQFREAHAEAKRAKAPSKPWRVYVAGPAEAPPSADYRSERAAYAAVKDWRDAGITVRSVHHWENGDWRLYERIEPQEG